MVEVTEIKKAVKAVEAYFSEMSRTYNTQGGTKEESHYPALTTLLNSIGESLSVVCVSQSADMGDGRPDFGLYAGDQADKRPPELGQAEPPKYGVVEAKALDANLTGIEKGDQVKKYLNGYQLVTATNYREFHLFRRRDDGTIELLESLIITNSEAEYWEMTATAKSRKSAAREHGPRIWEFFKRSMAYVSSISEPMHVAWFLASYAREAFAKIEIAYEGGQNDYLNQLKEEMEVGLDEPFEAESKAKGDRLFCSMIVQTIFYGIFSAWVTHAQEKNKGKFDWRLAGYRISIPVIQSIFDRLATSHQVDRLDIEDILDRTGMSLRRVSKKSFFRHIGDGEAIQHFYQPFLKAFDPESQITMGVWYTPPEIVKYMVDRVDSVLRTELGITAGLANENVVVLDPCCGTGAYVVEVLRKIRDTLRDESDDDSVGKSVRKAAIERIRGFEIMPAPLIVAHWQVNEYLKKLKAPLEDGKRASIFLTNSLIGWEKKEDKMKMSDSGIKDEHDLASDVKLNDRIMVVIGNPPYYGHATVKPGEEAKLVEKYKKILKESGKAKKSQLDDPYVKFFSVAEERVMKEKRGIVAYITNSSYLTGKSFIGLRQSLLESFDKMWIDEMSGGIFKLGNYQDGIGVDVAINLLVKKENSRRCSVLHRSADEVRPKERRKELLGSAKDDANEFEKRYVAAVPSAEDNFLFKPINISSENYDEWPFVMDICKPECREPGMHECRGWTLIDDSKKKLLKRMKIYCNNDVSMQDLVDQGHGLAQKWARFDAANTRRLVRGDEGFNENQIVRWAAFPFDIRYAYISELGKLWNEVRPGLQQQRLGNDKFLVFPAMMKGKDIGYPALFSSVIGNYHLMSTQSVFFPFVDYVPPMRGGGADSGEARTANLSTNAREWMTLLGFSDLDSNDDASSLPWYHILSICYSPEYTFGNADMLRVDYPKIPMPKDKEKLLESAKLGKMVATLLDIENGKITPELIPAGIKKLGRIRGKDYTVDKKWTSGTASKVKPGKGIVDSERNWKKGKEGKREEYDFLCDALSQLEIDKSRGFEILGKARDIYLNKDCFWEGVPDAVWKFRIGTRQVIPKWLSYRSETLQKEELDVDDGVKHVREIIWRLTALVLLADKLDANYRTCRDNAYRWPMAEY